MTQKSKEKIIKNFMKKYSKRGYKEISVKEDTILPDNYIVSAVEPLAGRMIVLPLKLSDIKSR